MHVTKRTPFRSTMTSFPRLSVANILFLEVLALQLVEDNLKQYNNLTESNKIVTALVNFDIKHDTPTLRQAVTNGSRYSRMDQVKFAEDNL